MPAGHAVCDNCGETLDVTAREVNGAGDLVLTVFPCQACMLDARTTVANVLGADSLSDDELYELLNR